MKTRIIITTAIAAMFYCSTGFAVSGPDVVGLNQSIIMFPGAPNPCDAKCLIRVYLPQKDANSSIKIYSADSTMVKQVSLAAESGIGSAVVNVSDLQPGKYTYQLYYQGDIRYTRPLEIKRDAPAPAATTAPSTTPVVAPETK